MKPIASAMDRSLPLVVRVRFERYKGARARGHATRAGQGEDAMAGQVLGTNHTSFTVSDLDRSIAFFTEALGFELLHRGGRDAAMIEKVVGVPGADIEVAYIQAPGHRMELIQYLGPADRGRVQSRPCDTGFAHVAFDVDDVDAVLAACARHGVAPVGPVQDLHQGPNAGGRVVYTRDADGITVEFIQKPKR
jgi:catechol 2,3-dioxygenase-like lactoylglutathione lyase family enzyme